MAYRNANIAEKGYIYGKWMTSPGTYTISYGGAVSCYLLIGGEKALLIDTAYGAGNLREFVEEITDKPVNVVNTHAHFDHTGGNPWWQEAYAGPGAQGTIKRAFSPQLQKEFDAKPYPDYAVHTVREGHVFDLGGRSVEVLEIPAHAESSIALLDHGARALFSGDELEAGQVLLFARSQNLSLHDIVRKHRSSMLKLKAREGDYDFIYPAHNGSPLHKSYVDDYVTLSDGILAGTATVMPDLAGFGWPPYMDEGSMFARQGALERAQYGGASFVYTKD